MPFLTSVAETKPETVFGFGAASAGIMFLTTAEELGLNKSTKLFLSGFVVRLRRVERDVFGKPERQSDINTDTSEILDRLGIDHLALAIAGEFSYGDQRRVELAIALAGRPKILLVDEPAAGMGRQETKDMVAVLAALPRDIALIIFEQDMDVVSALADRVTVLQNGTLIASRTWDDVRSDAAVKRAYMGSARSH